MTELRRTCEFCRDSVPVNHTNGIVVSYQAEGKKDISVLLHKSCAAAWSKRFTQSVAIQIQPIH
jgi:hypothetical protein